MRRCWGVAGIVVAVSVLAACSAEVPIPGVAYGGGAAAASASPAATSRPLLPVATIRAPSAAATVVSGTAPGALTAAFARTLFASSPVVVVSGTSGTAV